jgi:hypothetical protein
MKLGTLLGRSALIAASLAMVASTAHAAPPPGGTLGQTLYKAGSSNIMVQFIDADAAYNNDLSFYLTIGGAREFIFRNHAASQGDVYDVVSSSLLGAGIESIFGLCADMGGASAGSNCASNPFYSGNHLAGDGLLHAMVWDTQTFLASRPDLVGVIDPGFDYVIGFEDIYGGGDFDYNDAIFAIKGVSTSTPEPVSMSLLATGLAGMGGAGAMKRRRKNK